MRKTYKGGCRCGAVRFEADIDLAADMGRCHCTLCTLGISTRSWSATVQPEAFRLLAGEDMLSDYQFGRLGGLQSFCRQCGARSFERGSLEGVGAESVSIQLSALDDVAPEDMVATAGRSCGGHDEGWRLAPAPTRRPLAAITSARSRAARRDPGRPDSSGPAAAPRAGLRTPAPATR
jgi:hypothetical protein